MNKLHRDLKLRGWAIVVNGGCFVSLVILALAARYLLGLEEREFYREYPVGWWVIVVLGLAYIASMLYAVKKTMDTHPNIQLRSKPDEVLERVLADPEYGLWHQEALRLLEQRRKKM